MSTGRLGAGDTAIQPTIFDAKADILTATAADTPARLAVGSNGQYLKADSTTATGLAWATLPASGKVLQVVYGSAGSVVSSSSSTQADTNLSATITPSSTSSKVLILVAQNGVAKNASFSSNSVNLYLYRGSTELYKFQGDAAHTNTAVRNDIGSCSTNYLDSPNTTSAVTYKTRFSNPNNTAEVYVNQVSTSTIILMEIGA